MKKIAIILLVSLSLVGIGQTTKIKYKQMENPATSSVNLGTQTFSAGAITGSDVIARGTLSCALTSTFTGITTHQAQVNGTTFNASNRFTFNSGDASYRLVASGYGTRIFGYNPMSGVEEEKFAIQSSRSNTGANYSFSFTPTSFTNQTASAETPVFAVGAATVGHATGAITTQRDFQTSSITHSATAASTITDSYGAYFPKATAGTNVSITNNYGLGTDGNILVAGTASLGSGLLTGGNSGTVAVLSDAVFTTTHFHSITGPFSNFTAYFDKSFHGISTAAGVIGKTYVPYNCTLIGYSLLTYVAGTLGSAESQTYSVRVNNTTDITLTTAGTATAITNIDQASNLNTNLNAGDYIEIKAVIPTMATPYTNTSRSMTLFFVRRK